MLTLRIIAFKVLITNEVSAAQVISEDLGMKLENVDLSLLGRAKKATVSKDDTIVLDGYGEKAAIEARCEQIRQAIEDATSDYDKCAATIRRPFSSIVLAFLSDQCLY